MTIYKAIFSDVGPDITFSLIVREDFSWALSYKKELVDRGKCPLLANVPSLLRSGMFSF